MSERIRYRKLSDNSLESYQTFTHPVNGAEYSVKLDKQALKYSIVEVGSNLTAKEGTGENLPKVQRLIRQDLTDLGVNLHRGSRGTHLE